MRMELAVDSGCLEDFCQEISTLKNNDRAEGKEPARDRPSSPLSSEISADDIVDVVNISLSGETPTKEVPRPDSSPVSTSTPDTHRKSGGHFSPVCSPILRTRDGSSVSPDSSGYCSSSPQQLSGVSGGYDFTPSPGQRYSRRKNPHPNTQSPNRYQGHPNPSSHLQYSPDFPRGGNPPAYHKNVRTTYTSAQVRVLENVFVKDQYPEPDTIEEISREINIPGNKIKVWFQNRRARVRRRIGMPVTAYGLAPYPSRAGLTGVPGTTPPMPMIAQGASGYPMMPPLAMLPRTLPLPAMPQAAALPPYPGYYNNLYPSSDGSAIPAMLMGHCPFPPSLPYPEYSPYPYPIPGLSHFQQQNTADMPSDIDQSQGMYVPNSVPSAYPNC